MAKSRSAAAVLDRSPGHLLHRALQLALDVYAAEVGDAAVTQRQFAVLCAVSADEGLSQSGLVRATGIDRSTLADMVARMIEKGLLTRERSQADGRANTVHLTRQGREALDAVAPRAAAADRALLALLGAKKRDAFVDALRRLARSGEAAMSPEAPLDAGEIVDRKVAKTKTGKSGRDKYAPAKAGKIKSGKKKRKRDGEGPPPAEPAIP